MSVFIFAFYLPLNTNNIEDAVVKIKIYTYLGEITVTASKPLDCGAPCSHR